VKKLHRLKRVYADVVRGVSLTKVNSVPLYVKHPNSVEAAVLEYKYEDFFQEAIDGGLQTAEEREKYLLEIGVWTESKNMEILKWKEFLKSMQVTKTKVLLKQDIESINNQIKEGETTLLGLEVEKQEKLGYIAEAYAAQKFNDYIVLQSFFTDAHGKEKYFTDEVFDEMNDEELGIFNRAYSETMINYREEMLKKLAIQGFFQNYVSLCEKDISKFYGKPIVDLTNYQMNLFSLGVYYQNALKEYGGQATEEMLEDPDAFVEKVVQKQNVDKVLSKDGTKGPSAQSVVGMTKEDRERVGITNDQMMSMSKFVGKSFEDIALEFNS
jgi:hypothetical protein